MAAIGGHVFVVVWFLSRKGIMDNIVGFEGVCTHLQLWGLGFGKTFRSIFLQPFKVGFPDCSGISTNPKPWLDLHRPYSNPEPKP